MTHDADPLARATAAMRTIDPPSSDRAAAVRRAVIEGASAPRAPIARAPRAKGVAAALLLAAALGGTAFAAVATRAARTPSHPRATVERSPAPRALLSRSSTARTTEQTVAPIAPLPTSPIATERPTERLSERTVAPVSRAARALARHAASTVNTGSVESAPPRASGAQAPARAPTASISAPIALRDALYHEAHEAHFVARDPALALTRWNAYLAAEPSGQFAPEAQFNRVVCLVRLGRRAEALAALDALPREHYRHADAERLRAQLQAR